jgi:TonB family protein
MRGALIAAACALAMAAPDGYMPARYKTGAVPDLPALAVGAGEVVLEVDVDASGNVTGVAPLRTTPPFTAFLTDAVRSWRFSPATRLTPQPGEPAVRTPVPSRIAVVGVFRPPSLIGPTLGEAPRDAGTGSADVALPLSTTMPSYPPAAFSPGVVLAEVLITPDGSVGDLTILRSAPPFDTAALDALRTWRFRPARLDGAPVASYVDVVFGFPVPIVTRGR